MSRASFLARWIIRAELHLVGIMHPSTIRAFDHSRLFSILFGVHDNVRLPNAIREATTLVALNDVLYQDILASYTGCGGHLHDCTSTSLVACPVGDMFAFIELPFYNVEVRIYIYSDVL